MESTNKYIHFDWAVKHMLRDKANFAVLEGLITVLFGRKITIVEILENKEEQNNVVARNGGVSTAYCAKTVARLVRLRRNVYICS